MRSHGIDPQSRNAWCLNLERATARRTSGLHTGLRLVELVPTSTVTTQPHYVLHIADLEVAVDDTLREGPLVRLVRALHSC